MQNPGATAGTGGQRETDQGLALLREAVLRLTQHADTVNDMVRDQRGPMTAPWTPNLPPDPLKPQTRSVHTRPPPDLKVGHRPGKEHGDGLSRRDSCGGWTQRTQGPRLRGGICGNPAPPRPLFGRVENGVYPGPCQPRGISVTRHTWAPGGQGIKDDRQPQDRRESGGRGTDTDDGKSSILNANRTAAACRVLIASFMLPFGTLV